MLSIIKYAFIISLLVFSAESFALSKLGHQLVCELAYQQLPDAKKQTLNELLNNIPAAHKHTINQYTYHDKNADVTFANGCTWADAIKNRDEFRSFKSWHYMNVPRDAKMVVAEHCTKPCLLNAIHFHQVQLSTTQDKTLQWQALLFLGHWLGDIHQPLHVSFSSDLGGNKSLIESPIGKCKNLHWLWDQCLLNYGYMELKDDKRLPLLLTELLALSPQPSTNKLSPDSAVEWANESYSIVTEPAFQYCIKENGQCLASANKSTLIEEKYFQHYNPILKQQIVNAAQRLSVMLEQTL